MYAWVVLSSRLLFKGRADNNASAHRSCPTLLPGGLRGALVWRGGGGGVRPNVTLPHESLGVGGWGLV